MANRRRPEADDLLQMAEHRRSMHALRNVSRSAADVASRTRHLHAVPAPSAGDPAVAILPVPEPDAPAPQVLDTPAPAVVSLAAARARRVGHPAGSSRRS